MLDTRELNQAFPSPQGTPSVTRKAHRYTDIMGAQLECGAVIEVGMSQGHALEDGVRKDFHNR